MNPTITIAIDTGAASVKGLVLAGQSVLEKVYLLHRGNAGEAALSLLKRWLSLYRESVGQVVFTGSAGKFLAKAYGLPYVEEEKAIRSFLTSRGISPDFTLEIGGESAKLTRFHPSYDRRENRTCAGGTGAFLQHASRILSIPLTELDGLAEKGKRIYPIASRCGVYAKTDMQALLNDGAHRADLALSLFHALAVQFIGGLSYGSPISGKILLLGGPFYFFSTLRKAVLSLVGRDALVLPDGEPSGALYYGALGAASAVEAKPILLSPLTRPLERGRTMDGDFTMEEGLFAGGLTAEAFHRAHEIAMETGDIRQAKGPLWLGMDAGSTTLKAVLMDGEGRILTSRYERNRGDLLQRAGLMIRSLYDEMPEGSWIAGAGVTGYGEGLIQRAFHFDMGEVETMAHLTAARHFCPEVTALLDIGGQDMKYMELEKGKITRISLNGSCASGCGSFLETFAESMGLSMEDFVKLAEDAPSAPDLGHHCTVIMNTAVKRAEAQGADRKSVAAALCLSVVKNALFRVIGLSDTADMGDHIIVEGGTFYNDAVLRAFEKITGKKAIRPPMAGLMGAYGMALLARNRFPGENHSALPPRDKLLPVSVEVREKRCSSCGNRCLVTARIFSDGSRFITGKRCSLGELLFPGKEERKPVPDMAEWVKNHVFARAMLKSPKGKVGIPAVLDMWSDFPFWRGFWESLGYEVVPSFYDEGDFRRAMMTIPRKARCHGCRIAHGHVENLLRRKVDFIWMPIHGRSWAHDDNDERRHSLYGKVLSIYMGNEIRRAGTTLLCPKLPEFDSSGLAEKLAFSLPHENPQKVEEAVRKGREALAAYETAYAEETERILAEIRRTREPAFVLAGRSFTLDPQIQKGVPYAITSMGIPVLTTEGLYLMTHQKGRGAALEEREVLEKGVEEVLKHENLQLILLHPVGCDHMREVKNGVKERLLEANKYYTELTLDQGSSIGALKIRLRTLKAELEEGEG